MNSEQSTANRESTSCSATSPKSCFLTTPSTWLSSNRRRVARAAQVRFYASLRSRHCFSAEEPLNQFVTADFEMGSNVSKNCGQCSHLERVVIRNRDMMLVPLSRSQSQMTSRLPCDHISKVSQPFSKIRSRNISR